MFMNSSGSLRTDFSSMVRSLCDSQNRYKSSGDFCLKQAPGKRWSVFLSSFSISLCITLGLSQKLHWCLSPLPYSNSMLFKVLVRWTHTHTYAPTQKQTCYGNGVCEGGLVVVVVGCLMGRGAGRQSKRRRASHARNTFFLATWPRVPAIDTTEEENKLWLFSPRSGSKQKREKLNLKPNKASRRRERRDQRYWECPGRAVCSSVMWGVKGCGGIYPRLGDVETPVSHAQHLSGGIPTDKVPQVALLSASGQVCVIEGLCVWQWVSECVVEYVCVCAWVSE